MSRVKLGVKLERLRLRPGDTLVVTYDPRARVNPNKVVRDLLRCPLRFKGTVPIIVKERGVRFKVTR